MSETKKRLKDIRFLAKKRLVSNAKRSSVENEHLRAVQDMMRLKSGLKSNSEEKRLLGNTLEQASNTLNKLEVNFEGGLIRTPYDGFVGTKVPNEGEVIKPGASLLNVFTGAPYVLAYIPTGRFYQISAGDKVTISNGFREGRGRISTDKPANFTLFAKVVVKSPLW